MGFEYGDANRRTKTTLPNSVEIDYGYDEANQLRSIIYKRGATTLGDLSYDYDAVGRRTTVGGSFARTNLPQAFGSAVYNQNNQLAQWDSPNLTYDLNGNLSNDGTNTYTWNSRD